MEKRPENQENVLEDIVSTCTPLIYLMVAGIVLVSSAFLTIDTQLVNTFIYTTLGASMTGSQPPNKK